MPKMYELSYESINIVEIELTNKCALKCIHCPRNEYGGDSTIKKLDQREISFDEFKHGFTTDFIKQLDVLYLCGTHGDPIHNSHLLDIIKYIRTYNTNVFIDISTHGNSYSSKWWGDLATYLGKNAQVSFAIDGLEDTYHLYRKAGTFDKVIKNMSAFINYGGNARWSFIVFKHNQHQVDDARTFADSIGVDNFFVKRTSRFIDGRNENQVKDDDLQLINEIITDDGVKIEPPSIEEYIHPLLKKLKSTDSSILYSMNKSTIDCASFCRFDDKTHIYVDTHGIVTPCGWVGGHSHKSKQLNDIISKSGGEDECNIFNRPLVDIVNDKNGILSNIIKSWDKETIQFGKLKQCSIMCGSELNATSLNKLDRDAPR